MVKGAQVAEYDSARCFIYSLHRVVNESVKIQTEVLEAIANERRLETHFNHSGLAHEKLLEIKNELNLPQHQLVQDIKTRCNSTFYLYMAERLLKQKRVISLYVVEHDTLTNLTIQQWGLMKQCTIFLQPIEKITKITNPRFKSSI
ncbi:unnamed protein product [Euphydryas editha]|uniref:Uncharacterized protein n=1 Tax=Euphydryas editha TaxID=104508 RepID=A0AAU9UWC0_EUPED|nr:unnamed protein product [Euphydryas editha]